MAILNNLEPSDAIMDNLFKKVIYDKASNAIDEIVEDVENFLDVLKKFESLLDG